MIDESGDEFFHTRKAYKFSWTLKTASESEIIIKLHLENPEVYNGEQYVSVCA